MPLFPDMQLVLFIALISFVSIIAIVTIQIHPKNKSKKISVKSNQISAYSEKSSYEQAQVQYGLPKLHETAFIDIPTGSNNGFYGKKYRQRKKKNFTNHYISYIQEAYSLIKKLETLNTTPSVIISNLIRDFGNINKLAKQYNTREKWFTNLTSVGNMGSAAIYVALDELTRTKEIKCRSITINNNIQIRRKDTSSCTREWKNLIWNRIAYCKIGKNNLLLSCKDAIRFYMRNFSD